MFLCFEILLCYIATASQHEPVVGTIEKAVKEPHQGLPIQMSRNELHLPPPVYNFKGTTTMCDSFCNKKKCFKIS